MERRSFLKKSAVGAGVVGLAAPAVAAASPTINWRLASSFPKSLNTIYGAADVLAQSLREMTDGRFNIKVFAAGEIVPGLQVADAVRNGTIEIGHTASYYYFGKDPTFAFDAAMPFGLTSRQQTAWMECGGGMKLMREFFDDYNIVNFLGGNTGTQMGGWFKKEIQTVKDLEGLKFRVGGLAGRVLSRVGVVPQQIAGGDVYPALEKGTIDAAEWVGPFEDEKLGFYKIAKNYYYPGWWDGGTQMSFYVSKREYEKLPSAYKAALKAASAVAHVTMQAEYDSVNPRALGRLVSRGVKLQRFSESIMAACFKATKETFEEEAERNPRFKRVYDNWRVFRNNEVRWFGVAEAAFASSSFNKAL